MSFNSILQLYFTLPGMAYQYWVTPTADSMLTVLTFIFFSVKSTVCLTCIASFKSNMLRLSFNHTFELF